MPLKDIESRLVVVSGGLSDERKHSSHFGVEHADDFQKDGRCPARGHPAVAGLLQHLRHGRHLDGFSARCDESFPRCAIGGHRLDVQASYVSDIDHAHAHVGQHWHLSVDHGRHHRDALPIHRRPEGRSENRAGVDDREFHVAAFHVVEVDLLSKTGWAEAMKGCTFVMHVASPFVLAQPKDENEMIVPAVEGTKRVIAAAQRARVKRLVLTSSTFAIIAGKDSGRYGTDAWSDTNANIGAYAKSKTMAERAAWEAVKGSDMELTV
ncbi:MAG: NAD-dependent epimerase/dehydratase family protein, partial [Burkholderiaceae bacterium]|nr:NAD-dependent epimerase/dehydratase family protein [Burkholderiaceae bacterium]